jgi:hypothetical protein
MHSEKSEKSENIIEIETKNNGKKLAFGVAP